jgi:hypothetical protein
MGALPTRYSFVLNPHVAGALHEVSELQLADQDS